MIDPSEHVADEGALSPLSAFTGVIVPRRTGFLYKSGLAAVAFAMVLLPAMYVGLIVLVAWCVFYHLRNDAWIASGFGILQIIGYLGPAVAGCILVFFMVKPLYARRPEAAEPVTLDPGKEPVLFGFVERICALVRAPMPSRIDVDLQVNASASLPRGFWSRDLVLTIGLPLAAGLEMRQFAGVLAHEFGHFAQGAGMRLTYVIRKINSWFARVVYERDRWDVELDEMASSSDWRIAIVLQAARGCVWLTRRILWFLMQVGHGISCFMLRQMEYDADSYEAKLAGSDVFASTIARFPIMSTAMQFAYADVRRTWTDNRLPENLPLLIEHKANELPADIRHELSSFVDVARSGWFDTHPRAADRVRAAQRLNEPGIFHMIQPAADLFADFEALSRLVTRHQYEKEFGLKFSDENLMPADEILRESAVGTEAEIGLRKFYGDVNISLKALLTESDWPLTAEPADIVNQWDAQRKAADELRKTAEKISQQWRGQHQRFQDATAAHYLTKARFTVDPGEYGLPEYAKSVPQQEVTAKSIIDKTQTAMAAQLTGLEPFIMALRQRVTLALRFAQTTLGVETAAEIDALALLLAAVGPELPRLREMGVKLRALSLLASNRDNHPNVAGVDEVTRAIAEDIKSQVAHLQDRLKNFLYPFPQVRGQSTVAEYVRSERVIDDELGRIFFEGDAHVDRLFALHFRLLGKLLAYATAAEEILGRQVNSAAC